MGVEQLQAIEGTTAGEVRRRIVGVLKERFGCDLALFYTLARHEGRCYHTATTPVGEDDLVERAEGTEGRPSLVSHLWDPFAPEPDEKNRFTTMAYEPRRLVEQGEGWVMRELYGKGHVPRQTRALLYEGDRLLGWIGMMRRRDNPFDPEDIDALDHLVPALRSALSTADRMERESLEGPADILMEPEGPSVEYASEEARAWLTTERIDLLPNTIRDHIRRIYRRLGIGSRAELANKIEVD